LKSLISRLLFQDQREVSRLSASYIHALGNRLVNETISFNLQCVLTWRQSLISNCP
jgi:hypothetical protein